MSVVTRHDPLREWARETNRIPSAPREDPPHGLQFVIMMGIALAFVLVLAGAPYHRFWKRCYDRLTR